MANININGEEYDLDALSTTAKDTIASIKYVEMELKKTQLMAAALKTAQNAYTNALLKEIGKTSEDPADLNIPDSVSFH